MRTIAFLETKIFAKKAEDAILKYYLEIYMEYRERLGINLLMQWHLLYQLRRGGKNYGAKTITISYGF